jgi:pimeloyl-ACP methyl ester carboxylesterase
MILDAIISGGGRPIVLLHGLFGAARNFGAVQRRLATSARVIALDLRNHGRSPHASGMDYPTMAADVLETLHALQALPCVLIGHSMGGKTAMRVALDAPDAVERLLISDIAPVTYRAGFRGYAEAMAALDLSGEPTRAGLDAALAPTVADPAVRAFLLQNVRLGPPASWRIGLREIAAGLPDIEAWPTPPAEARYAGPTLFVAGGASDYIRPEHRAPIRARFPAAHFVTLRKAGHWVHADDPEGFLQLTETFLQRQSRQPN